MKITIERSRRFGRCITTDPTSYLMGFARSLAETLPDVEVAAVLARDASIVFNEANAALADDEFELF